MAGTQSGKTAFGPIWLLNEITRCGPGDYLVVTPTFQLLAKKALPEFLRLFNRMRGLG
ncbi:MAG: terminase, partial [Caulobacteraceae bacterium]|nr:terminase [Caulobacteraceae bacterium]